MWSKSILSWSGHHKVRWQLNNFIILASMRNKRTQYCSCWGLFMFNISKLVNLWKLKQRWLFFWTPVLSFKMKKKKFYTNFHNGFISTKTEAGVYSTTLETQTHSTLSLVSISKIKNLLLLQASQRLTEGIGYICSAKGTNALQCNNK